MPLDIYVTNACFLHSRPAETGLLKLDAKFQLKSKGIPAENQSSRYSVLILSHSASHPDLTLQEFPGKKIQAKVY